MRSRAHLWVVTVITVSAVSAVSVVSGVTPPASHARAAADARAEAAAALRKAVEFFHESVAVEGGYVWRYSADLKKREGEGKVGPTTAWVQPPGTPFVGEALLTVYELTKVPYYLDCARATALALVKGQLRSGGWTARIELDPSRRKRFAYRAGGGGRKARDVSTLDDDMTQSALRFLVRFDEAVEFQEKAIHEAALYGLKSVLEAQFPNGAWAQVFRGAPREGEYPVRPASYRKDGKYQRVKRYWRFYTLNDNLMSDMTRTLLLAARVYKDDRYRAAAIRGGEFLIRAQMPEPQPGWAQQYDFEMHPAWARKFEPPAITGSESQKVMQTLLDLYEATGKRKFLRPVPKALAYFRRSLLPDGRLARFYELGSNRPLYFTRQYELTYEDDDLPTHYSFKTSSRLDAIERRYKKLAGEKRWRRPPRAAADSEPPPSAAEVRSLIESLDERGAWVEPGRLRYWGPSDPTRRIISPRTFARNAVKLARFVGS